jgi:hypothetical protein
MVFIATSPLIHDLERQLGDLTRIPVADCLAALVEVERIEAELAALGADEDGPATARVMALAAETQFVLATLLPECDQTLFTCERGSPAEHPPLAAVLAALGFIKNALVKSLPDRKPRAATAPTSSPSTRAESTRTEDRYDR